MVEKIDYCIIGDWLLGNLNWITPLIITIIFSIVNIRMVKDNFNLVKAQNKLQNEMAKAQKKLQNDSFCYQLLDRRMKLYTDSQEIIRSILANAAVSTAEIAEFGRLDREVKLLFGAEVVGKMDDLYNLICEYRAVSSVVNQNIELHRNSPNHAELCDKESELLMRLTDEYGELADVFAPYICFKDYKIQTDEKVS